MAVHVIENAGNERVRISHGNGKLGGIPQFNTLPGDEPVTNGRGEALVDIKGTCGKLCGCCVHDCYAVRLMKFHHNTCVKAWGINTLALRERPQDVKESVIRYCRERAPRYFRFHTAGEIESVGQFEMYCQIAEEVNRGKRGGDRVMFYTYTKNFEVVSRYLSSGGKIPSSFVVNLSQWHGNIDEYIKEAGLGKRAAGRFMKLNRFIYDDHTEELTGVCHCPAIDAKGHETGVKCAACGRCMRPGHVTACHAH